MKKFLFSLFTFILIVSLIVFTYLNDEQSNSYKNIQEVKSDNAIERGWIPSILPPSAFDIEETHNLDSNVFYGSFYYKEEDEAVFIKHLIPISKTDNTYSYKDFMFHIDKKLRKVWYRNKVDNLKYSYNNIK